MTLDHQTTPTPTRQGGLTRSRIIMYLSLLNLRLNIASFHLFIRHKLKTSSFIIHIPPMLIRETPKLFGALNPL